MRVLMKLVGVLAAGVFTYIVVLPLLLVLGLVVLVLGGIAAVEFLFMLVSIIGWLVTHDPAALRATLTCAAIGSAASLPFFAGGYYMTGAWSSLKRRRQVPALDAPFVEPAQRSLSAGDR